MELEILLMIWMWMPAIALLLLMFAIVAFLREVNRLLEAWQEANDPADDPGAYDLDLEVEQAPADTSDARPVEEARG